MENYSNLINCQNLPKIASDLKEIFHDRMYFEIQRHNENDEKNFEHFILKSSKFLNIPLIATQEVYYLNQDMYEAHDALKCIGEKKFLDDKSRFKLSDQHYLKQGNDITKLYSDIPEALENNYNFHLRFSFKPKKSKPILPSITYGKNRSAEDELLKQVKEGLENRTKI